MGANGKASFGPRRLAPAQELGHPEGGAVGGGTAWRQDATLFSRPRAAPGRWVREGEGRGSEGGLEAWEHEGEQAEKGMGHEAVAALGEVEAVGGGAGRREDAREEALRDEDGAVLAGQRALSGAVGIVQRREGELHEIDPGARARDRSEEAIEVVAKLRYFTLTPAFFALASARVSAEAHVSPARERSTTGTGKSSSRRRGHVTVSSPTPAVMESPITIRERPNGVLRRDITW